MSDDSIPPATREDLRWWLDRAPTLRWTWAKTYADFAPHWWVRGGRTPGFSAADSVRVGRIVRTFGEPGKFWRSTNLYLFTEDRARKFWCIFSSPPGDGSDVRIVNLAHADKTYGPQNDFDQQRLAALRLGGAE